ncbi:MAG: hypothetical protein M3Q71_13820 [Chloroflexota bacterium]|nr:hypothetical protein [Chloroflexota bacterium]
MREFVPVAAGYRGRRGFETAPTKRLTELLARYKQLRDDPAADPSVRSYAREIIGELRAEFDRREAKTPAAA